ncbi:hypothetical protein WMF18_17095 [Sorangium sp. So ce315]|uniref:hypothetical protein n=1 Tax=Sorangium sp. So ce315 TaxID=3133299 RepID=UPI003F6353C9
MTTGIILTIVSILVPTSIELATLIRAARAEGRPIDRRALALCLAKLACRALPELPLDE